MKKKGLAVLTALFVLLTSLAVFSGSVSATADGVATRGDVNNDGSIDMKDVLSVRKVIAHMATLTDEEAADVNADNSVDMKDVLLMRQFVANWNVTLATRTAATTTATEPTATTGSTDTTGTTGTTGSTKAWSGMMTPDQITMTYYDPDCTQYGLTWHTLESGKAPTVQIVKGETTDPAAFTAAETVAGNTTAHETSTMPYDYETNTFTWDSPKKVTDYVHRAVLKGLDFGTIYSYRVGDANDDVWSDIATFKTRPESTNSFTFIDITDTQAKENQPTYFKYMRAALEGAYSQVSDPAFILHGGDFVENSKYMNLWRNMLNGNADLIMGMPIMSVCGNHDSTYKTDDHEQVMHFNVGVDTKDMNTELGMYYSYNYGNAHFVVLNSNSTREDTDGIKDERADEIDEKQYEWLEKDLKANTKEWTFVALHHPLYAPCSKNGDEKPVLQAQLQQLFNDYNVDVVVESHEHMYVQTWPIDESGKPLTMTPTRIIDDVTYYENPGAPIYTMAGKGGYGGDSPYGTYDASLFADFANGHDSSWAIYKIDGHKLTVSTYYSENGKIKTYGEFGIIHADS